MKHSNTIPRKPAGPGQASSGNGTRMGRIGMALAASLASAFLLSAAIAAPVNAQETRIFSVNHRNTAQVAGTGGVPGAIIKAYDAETDEEIGDATVNTNGSWGIVFPQPLERGTAIRVEVPAVEGSSARTIPIILEKGTMLPPEIDYFSTHVLGGYAPANEIVSIETKFSGQAKIDTAPDGSWNTGGQLSPYLGEQVSAYSENANDSQQSNANMVNIGNQRPNPPYNITLNEYNAIGMAGPNEFVEAYTANGNLLGSTYANSFGNWSISQFSMSASGGPVYFISYRDGANNSPNSSVYATRQLNVENIATPVIQHATPTRISGTEATPNTVVTVFKDQGGSVSVHPAKVQSDGSWTVVPDTSLGTLDVGTAIYAYAQDSSTHLNSQRTNFAIVGSDGAATVNYMPYVSFAIDSSESVTGNGYNFEIEIVGKAIENLYGITVLDVGIGVNANKNIANHVSVFQIVSGEFYIDNQDYQYISQNPGFFDPSIFSAAPQNQAFFSNNTNLDDLVSTINGWGYFLGLSVNMDGFVWSAQTIYNTPASDAHPQPLGMYDDVKAATVVLLTDGFDNEPNEAQMANAFEQNNTCGMVTSTLQQKGVSFEPYWVTINGVNGEDPPVNKAFLTKCFDNATYNTHNTNGDTSQTSAENAADAVFNAIIELGNSVPR